MKLYALLKDRGTPYVQRYMIFELYLEEHEALAARSADTVVVAFDLDEPVTFAHRLLEQHHLEQLEKLREDIFDAIRALREDE